MKLKLIMLVSLVAFGFALTANAGSVADGDGDLVPDSFDNCSADLNGPNDPSNQIDTDVDGFGNRCDGDFDQDGGTNISDFTLFIAELGGTNPNFDMDGDGGVNISDFTIFINQLGGTPGPSGLACAGTPGCTA